MKKRIFLILGILIAALVVALIAVSAKTKLKTEGSGQKIRETASSEKKTEENEAGGTEAPVAEVTPEIVLGPPIEVKEEPEEVRITVTAAGDCTLGSDEDFAYESSFIGTYDMVGDPSYFLANVKPVFDADDLTIINMEGTLTYETEPVEKAYAFKGDPSYTAILTSSGVEAANFANNHAYDYGEQSYYDTIRYLDEAGIVNFGYDRHAVIEIKGVKVGLIGSDWVYKQMGALDQLLEQLEAVKAEGAELILASCHWGIERDNYPMEDQIAIGHALIDAGADLVIGHHPHVLQGIETYHGKKIIYSLGNFCFGGNSNPSDKDTMIYQQTFTIRDGEVLKDDDVNIIPCRVSSTTDYNDYQPTPLEGDEAQRVLDRIAEYSYGLSVDP